MLDGWTKDLLSSYQYMNDKERSLVRTFLNLDLSISKDIYLQDKLANGMVEAPRAAAMGIATPGGMKNRSPSKPGHGNRSECGSRDDSASQVRHLLAGCVYCHCHLSVSNVYVPSYVNVLLIISYETSPFLCMCVLRQVSSLSALPPRGARSGHKTPDERRAGYRVKIASAGSLGQTKSLPQQRQKLHLKDMDGSVFTDDNSVDSPFIAFPAKGKSATTRRGDSDLTFIREEDDSMSNKPSPSEEVLEENLLKIGMKDKTSEKTSGKKNECCLIM